MKSKQISGVFNMTTMDRAYFKRKDTGKEVELMTKCCDTPVDQPGLNRNSRRCSQ